MSKHKLNPAIEILDIAVIIVLDHYYLRRWLPPTIASLAAGVAVALISSALYLIAWGELPKRLLLFILLAIGLSLLIR
jgi:hypothetical protein